MLSLVERYLNSFRSLGGIRLEKITPIWWKDAYSAIVLRFKWSTGEDNGANIDRLKETIKKRHREGMPGLEEIHIAPGAEMLAVEFDAQLVHAIIDEKGESDKYQDKDFIMKRFETLNIERDLLCAWATFALPDDDSTQHLVLKDKSTSKYRCTLCGNTNYLLRCEPMPDQFIEKHGSEQMAKRVRDRILQGFVARDIESIIEEPWVGMMLGAGLYNANNPPAGRAH